MEKEFDIVYILGDGSPHNNEELRYSLRSVEKHIKGVRNVFVVGENPGFLSDKVIYIPALDPYPCDLNNKDRNIWHKLETACKHPLLSEDFLFSADDNIVLKDSTWSDFIPRHLGLADNRYCDRARLFNKKLNDWTKTRIKTFLRFDSAHRYLWHPHMFTQINKTKFLRCCKDSDYRNRNDVIIFTYYFNHEPIPRLVENFDTEEYQQAKTLTTTCRHISHWDAAFSYEPFKTTLEMLFPAKSKYESTDILYNAYDATIIIPCYNSERYIDECIQSVLNQNTQKTYEIICVNDGSTDNTLNILNSYQSKYNNITVINFNQNKGLSAARNAALDITRGKYICLLDSDDKFDELYIEKTIPQLNKYNLDILYINAKSFFDTIDDEVIFERYKKYYNRKQMRSVMTGKNTLLYFYNMKDNHHGACSYIFNRNFLEKHALRYIDNVVYEDVPFNLNASLLAKRIFNITDQIYFRRVRQNSIVTEEKTFKHFRSYMIVIYNLAKHINSVCDDKDVKLINYLIQYQLKPMFMSASHVYFTYEHNKKVFKDMYKYDDAQKCIQLYIELSKKDLTQIQSYYSILKD